MAFGMLHGRMFCQCTYPSKIYFKKYSNIDVCRTNYKTFWKSKPSRLYHNRDSSTPIHEQLHKMIFNRGTDNCCTEKLQRHKIRTKARSTYDIGELNRRRKMVDDKATYKVNPVFLSFRHVGKQSEHNKDTDESVKDHVFANLKHGWENRKRHGLKKVSLNKFWIRLTCKCSDTF